MKASFTDAYKRLNRKQKEAVDAIDGPVLVLAGPGTGKTQLLSVRTSNILLKNEDLSPGNVLVLTFTNAAAGEMRKRLAAMIGYDGYNVEVQTFHGFANSIILESEEALDFISNKIEISEVEKIRALEYILDNVKGVEALRPFGAPYIHRSEIERRISELKNEGVTPEMLSLQVGDLVPDGINIEEKHIARLKALSVIYSEYEKLKNSGMDDIFDDRGRYDFDDMILLAMKALEDNAELMKRFRRQYRYIMVDEFQDTNRSQMDLLFCIVDPSSRNICCVGDDDQSIFRFQGATLFNFRLLKEFAPSVRSVNLKINYRSSEKIIHHSAGIIRQIEDAERVADKQLSAAVDYDASGLEFIEFHTEEEELSWLMDRIRTCAGEIASDASISSDLRKNPYNNIAVLVRKREQIEKIADACLRAGIPYATDGKEDISGEKRVRQMLDVMELVNSGSAPAEDRSLLLYRVLMADHIQADPADVLKFISHVNVLKQNERRQIKNGRLRVDDMKGYDLYDQFIAYFDPEELMDEKGANVRFMGENSLGLKDPDSLARAARALRRMVRDSAFLPAHDLLLRYIDDSGLYSFLLSEYDRNRLLRIRDLRALVSFINMIKDTVASSPSMLLSDLMKEIELRKTHGLSIQGKLATLCQDGVRVLTAHSSKGLEFHTVFMPFCLDKKSWPVRSKADVIPLPPEIYRSKEKVEEKEKLGRLRLYDEIRLFYVASTRAKVDLFYTSAPVERKVSSPFLSACGLGSSSVEIEEELFLEKYLAGSVKDILDAVDTREMLKNTVSDMSLNPTSIGTYIDCPRKFLYNDVLRLPGRKNQHLVFGNCVHASLEEVYSQYMEKGAMPPFDEFRKHFIRELRYQGISPSISNWCLDRLETLKRWYSRESARAVVPLDLEKKFEVTFPEGFVFTGKFDKIEEAPAGGIRVVDYKTGKPDKHIRAISSCRDLSDAACDNYFRQLVSYKLLYDRNIAEDDGKKVSSGSLQFVEPVSRTVKKYNMEKGCFHDIDVELSDEMAVELERLVRRVWRDIQDLEFDKLQVRDGRDKCRRCPYDGICWG
jgi:DNA helicase-2/ATP-dependent DNA helicase PcrA